MLNAVGDVTLTCLVARRRASLALLFDASEERWTCDWIEAL
jgi:hypothetical protein